MSIKTFAVVAAVALGTFAFADRADAQYRGRGRVYSGYATPYYGNVYNSGYYSNGVYSNGVVQAGYNPYRSSYYSPYTSGYYSPYNNAYYNGGGLYNGYNGFNNIYNSGTGIGVGTSGVIIGGIPIIR